MGWRTSPDGAGFDIGIDEFTETLLMFAGYIVDHSLAGSHSEQTDPMMALGAPDSEFVSPGVGGWIELALLNEMSDSIIVFEAPGESKSLVPEGFSLYGKKALGAEWRFIGNGFGTTAFMLPYELSEIRYVRIMDDGDGDPYESAPGFDLDAVGAGAFSSIEEAAHFAKSELNIGIFTNPFNSSCEITAPANTRI